MLATNPSRYFLRHDGVYEFVMTDATRDSVDGWLAGMTELSYALYECSYDKYGQVLVDLRIPGMMPVTYGTIAVEKWTAEHVLRPVLDVAVVYRYGLISHLAEALSGMSRLDDGVRLFHKGRYDDAVRWLATRRLMHNSMAS